MRSASILRKLREFQPPVPLEKAKAIAEQFGDDGGIPTPSEKLLKEIARAKRKQATEQHRREFRVWCRGNDLPNPTHEYQFAKLTHKRGWKADWAWVHPDGGGVLLEIDGGGWKRGRHHRPAGFREDQEKRNAALELGFKPVHVTPETLYSDTTLHTLKALLCAHSP